MNTMNSKVIVDARKSAHVALEAFLSNQTEENYMAWIVAQSVANDITLEHIVCVRQQVQER